MQAAVTHAHTSEETSHHHHEIPEISWMRVMTLTSSSSLDSLTAPAPPTLPHRAPTAEQIAEIVAGIPVIGGARDALADAGWQTTIAGNRITIDDEVIAQFIACSTQSGRTGDGYWVIFRIGATPPVWIVGAGSGE